MAVKLEVSRRGQDGALTGYALVQQPGGHPARLADALPHEAQPAAVGQVGVKGDARDALRTSGGDPALNGRVVDGADGKALRALGPHGLQQLHRLLGQVRLTAADQHLHPGFLQLFASRTDALRHLRSELPLPIGQQDPQGQGAEGGVRLPPVGLPGGNISQLPHGLLHPPPDLLIYVGPVV